MSLRPVLLVALAVALAACDGGGSAATADVTVVSRDLYRGFRLDTLAGAPDAIDLGQRMFDAYRQAVATDAPARAGRLADEIASARPALVALQEATLFRTQTPSDGGDPLAPDAERVTLDLLALLTDSLRARGLDYRVVARTVTADWELPATSGRPLFDVRVTDRLAVLAAPDVQADSLGGAALGGTVAAGPHRLPDGSGYAAVRATVDGVTFGFASVRLRGGLSASVLDSALGTGPAVVAGETGDAPAGWADAWPLLRPDAGPTCCLGARLTGETASFSIRPDRILVRGGEPVAIERSGTTPNRRTPSGRWPSDHAGLGARLRIGR